MWCEGRQKMEGGTWGDRGSGGKKKRPGSIGGLIPASEGGGCLLSHFRSTIGAAGFNFSVRNGKRWIPRAIAALVLFAVSVLFSVFTVTGAPAGRPAAVYG